MPISDAVQTLSAAFAFGILLQAAAGALFIYYRGHGSTIFQDGRRLVLILFLLFAALWAQTQFLNLLLADTMATACQATLIVSTMFDQLARIGIEQFLLWSVGQGTKLTTGGMILQGILLVRMGAGGVLVGFTRPQFAPVCVAQTSITALAIVVLALDAIIIGVLLVRAASLGMFKEMRGKSSSTRQEQSKALVFSVIALGFWTGSSVPMILGIASFNLMIRTVVPANGLLVLVAVVTIFPGALLLAREENGTTPEARSPFVTPMPPREILEDNVRSNGSPISTTNRYTRDGSLFVVNPSNTPGASPTVFQRSPRGDTRGFTKLGNEISVRDISGTPPERPERPDRTEVRGPGYRGSSGVFPSMTSVPQAGLQGAMAPQIRSDFPLASENGAAFQFPAVQQKRSMFGWSKQAPVKPSIRTLAISNPVALDVSGGISQPQPFPKMQTIDLATAASIESERREQAMARLVANRSAPQPPQFSTEEAFRRSVSIKRKETPSLPVEPMPIRPAASVAGLSQNSPNGVTSSVSLSPGHEEVRKRSPRQTNSFDQTFSEKAPPPTLQRKQTFGLPSNPRATRVVTPPQETARARPQTVWPSETVMLMNDVVFDNPGLVQDIIKDAPGMYASAQKTREMEKHVRPQPIPLKSSDSVLHRPRPYERKKNEDRALFPSEPSPGHRRSRSGSSIRSALARKSGFMSEPGSPSRLPCLPPLPPPLPPAVITSAANLKRLLPNDTKSMTFDEKIELLFPAPPGPITNRNRRSSVPSLPRVPSVFISDTPMIQSPSLEEEERSRRVSKRTTIASFAAPDIPAKSLKRQSARPEEVQEYQYSAKIHRTSSAEVEKIWSKPEKIDAQRLGSESQRQSIVNVSRKSLLTDVSEDTSQDDATTYWGSVHSQVAPPIDLTELRQQANSLYIQRPDTRTQMDSTPFEFPNPLPDDLRRCEAFVPLILDAEAHRVSFTKSNESRESFSSDPYQSLPDDKSSVNRKNENGWHHRIGDELPTFSERTYPKGRKMPPPTPLLLNRTGKRATVVVRSSEISPPADDPEKAIADIQAQLNRFEDEPSRDSVGSMLRQIPENHSTGAPDTGRLRLLENLEKEMGQQESHWQQMQTNLDRDSVSEAMSPFTQAQSDEDSEASLSRQSSQMSLRTPVKIVRTRTRVRSSMTTSDRTGSTSSSDNSRASIWQQRLAEAQLEYMDHAPVLLQKKSLNFLSISKNKSPMISPTPPESVESETDIETELESDSDTEAMMRYQAPPTNKVKAELWQPSLPSPKAAFGRMWNPPYETVSTSSDIAPPARGIRPAQRRMENSLSILSTQLWIKPRSAEHSRPVVALWGSKLVRPRSIVTRPVTQRPQRKSKRMTFLPDIVESPVPLPNNTQTLGIYQFPWGETSDQPTYLTAFNPLLMGGPVQSLALDARSRQLEPEQSEYSSSFFDDYEEEDEDMDMEIDSDDDFDETTLLEIANLLDSSDVPSRESLFEPSTIIDDYDLDSDPESPYATAPPPVSRVSVQPLTMPSRSVAQLWAGDSSPPLEKAAPGLPQPESHVWDSLIPAKTDIVRSKSISSSAISVLSSRNLWAAPEAESFTTRASFMWSSDAIVDTPAFNSGPISPGLMWSAKTETTETRRSGMFTIPSGVIRSTDAIPAAIKMIKAVRPSVGEIPAISSKNMWTRVQNMEESTSWISKSSVVPAAQHQKASTLLWAPAPSTSKILNLGLFDVTVPRSSFRTSEAMPAAINMICKPRMSLAPMSTLTSTKLWRTGEDKCPIERDWISESSTRPDSPTYSTVSSGTSSPTSDSSSVKSTSTKASSIWASSFAAIPNWWDRKAKKSPADAPKDDSKNPSKIPVRQVPTPLVAVRESRVLASRDLWESRAPVLDKTPVKMLRRGTIVQPSAIPAPKALPSQYKRPVASQSDWDSALAQAIAAGSMTKVLTRSIYKKADWESALSQAIAAGSTTTTKVLTRSMYKKSDWESALSQAISQSQPRLQRPAYSSAAWLAALEDAVNASVMKPTYDASVLHPVFFTTSLISHVNDMHPAAMGHFSYKVAQPSMWKSASAPAVPEAAMLWLKNNVTPRTMTISVPFTSETPRKAMVVRTISTPVLESSAFWTPSQIAPQEKNWLLSSATARKTNIPSTQTWRPTIASPVSQNSTTMAAMWTSSSASTPDLFAQAKGSYIRQVSSSRPVELARLTSNEMFTPSARAVEEPTHWLHATSASAVPTRPKAWTWTPSSASTPDLFAHAKGSYIKQVSSSRPVAGLAQLNSNEMFTYLAKAVEEPKHWLHATSTTTPVVPTLSKALTWNPSSASTPDIFVQGKDSYIKQVSSSRPVLELARLDSNELFASLVRAVEEPTHWLHTTSVAAVPTTMSKALTWTPSTNPASAAQQTSMWQPQAAMTTSPAPLFTNPHSEPWSRTKRTAEVVDETRNEDFSQTMWRRSSDPPKNPRNWLVDRRASIVVFRY
ncbi:hypothetical protein VTL71DRAFT_1898 [Oculimacula yallundae]|uniref:Uncharacterized protein n=1 Tax=Oculimacula yallundae TaxID=86028 RepID=A0ABR4CC07_9HELO